MFSIESVLKAFKYLEDKSNSSLSHCKMLNVRAIALGYQSYHHFRETLKGLPKDEFGKVSLRVMRKICQNRMPLQSCAYYEFHSLPNRATGFYSHWIGWDEEGEEVRAPRPLNGTSTAKGLREAMSAPVYVIETLAELNVWRHIWHSTALVPEALAKESFVKAFDKEKFVSQDPPIEIIRNKISKYNNNFAALD
ncbi:hypothetical protein BZG29_03800 [Janthinobacterium sp. LM6]|uniref:hypothetical protein n=1 Tax=Janthinobacterium sp. LM6 TaxID=1938606 RepID=UPI000983CF2F|nr:hypothetical protein [Janthinobacterium sp. LM6]AQR67582.1 hypothetical protein BZG29_03800 [Janthinobacterium sp. LM6]